MQSFTLLQTDNWTVMLQLTIPIDEQTQHNYRPMMKLHSMWCGWVTVSVHCRYSNAACIRPRYTS